MKKLNLAIAILFVFILFTIKVDAQIPNSNFENWATAANGTDSLIGWSSSNAIVLYPVMSLYADSSSYQGVYAANIVTAPFGFVQYSTIGVLVNGEATFSYGGGGGGANVEYASGGGTPISYKPTELRGYFNFKTLAGPSETALGKVLLSKYNTMTNQRDTVSYSEFTFTNIADDYTPFSIALEDEMPGVIPDTITTIFYSSNPETVGELGVWSNLFIDSLSLFPQIPTSVKSPLRLKKSEIKVFPNPTTGNFNIENRSDEKVVIDIYNELGEQVKSLSVRGFGATQKVNMNAYPPGIYFLKSDNASDFVKKIILEK